MHCGPLGAMPDVIDSAVLGMCDSGIFGGSDLTDWKFRLQVHLNVAF